jgi:hypothetical protein
LTGATGDFDTRFSELQKQMLNPDDIAKQRADAIAAAMDPIAGSTPRSYCCRMNPINCAKKRSLAQLTLFRLR